MMIYLNKYSEGEVEIIIKILIADDDFIFRDLVGDILRKQEYVVLEACNGEEAIDLFFGNTDIDIIILDVMMPLYDGWEVLAEIRKHSDVPVIMLTALGDEESEIHSLLKGADDYITKPFSYQVFLARVDSQVRKIRKERESSLSAGKIEIDRQSHRVTACGEDISLSNKELQLLIYFINNENIVLSRDVILNNIWGYDFDGDIRTIDTHVKTLRAKLLECGHYVQTVRGSGYRFEVIK
ncbi:response regulator transcription factor [Proteocatella sphenisci]|uniref:response regulator transcription factor n=1 Tax=Proteocatella sphenisci TaxID=181070 RepID=UPI002E8E5818|nr:response regulator transcription factor [Proteocatella sphenisci]